MDIDPVSPESTPCFPQSAQAVSPGVHSTISNKISNRINNITPYNPPKGDVQFKKYLLREKEKTKEKNYPLNISSECYELLKKENRSEEEMQILRTYLTNNYKNKHKADIPRLSEIISKYIQ